MSERVHVSTRHRQTWWVVVVAAVLGLPLVVVAPVVTVLLLIILAFCAALLSAGSLPNANVPLAASLGLLIPVSLYVGLAILR